MQNKELQPEEKMCITVGKMITGTEMQYQNLQG